MILSNEYHFRNGFLENQKNLNQSTNEKINQYFDYEIKISSLLLHSLIINEY